MSDQVSDRAKELEEQLRKLTAAQLLFQCAGSLLNLAALRLGLSGEQGSKDLTQARQAIDGVRALLPVLEGAASASQVAALKDSLSQLQLLYAKLAGAGEGGQRPAGPAERSGRLWVPKGS